MTGFTLKIIAILSMLLDHSLKALPVRYIFVSLLGMPGEIYSLMITVLLPFGRLAFPIFAYLLAEGCRHTKSPEKYLLRLFIFALISELPYRFAFNDLYLTAENFLYFSSDNVFFTLLLAALGCFSYKQLQEKTGSRVLAILPGLAFAALAWYLSTDYGALGVISVLVCFVAPTKNSRLLSLALVMSVLYLVKQPFVNGSYMLFSNILYPLFWVFAMLGVALLAAYNGKRGRGLKWLFYVFYPAHLSAICALNLIFFM